MSGYWPVLRRLSAGWVQPEQAAGGKQRLGLADLSTDAFAKP